MSQCPYQATVDLSDENVYWEQDISYGQYLDLDDILKSQSPRSSMHDEMLFIVIHQVSELWIKFQNAPITLLGDPIIFRPMHILRCRSNPITGTSATHPQALA